MTYADIVFYCLGMLVLPDKRPWPHGWLRVAELGGEVPNYPLMWLRSKDESAPRVIEVSAGRGADRWSAVLPDGWLEGDFENVRYERGDVCDDLRAEITVLKNKVAKNGSNNSRK